MNARVNVVIPEALLQQSEELVSKGYFSNFSELVRAGLRDEITKHREMKMEMTDNDKKLFALVKDARKKGLLLSEKEMRKRGLKI